MAKISGKNARIYVEKYDLSGRLSEGTLTLTPRTEDVTCFSDGADTFLEGKMSWGIESSGFFDADAGQIDEILHGLKGTGANRTGFFPAGDTAGYVGYEGDAIMTNYEIPLSAQGACAVNCSFQGSGKPYRVKILYKGTVIVTGPGSGTGQNMGAAATAGKATLRVTAFTGTGFTVELKDSATGLFEGEETTLVTFTEAAAATEETVDTTSPLQYIQATWTGTFTSVTFIVTHGPCTI